MSKQTDTKEAATIAPDAGNGTTADRSILPLAQRPVQRTLAFFAALATLALLWASLSSYWGRQNPAGESDPLSNVGLIVDINSAAAPEFAVLPGVGPILAERIVHDRTINGQFESVAELSRVHGIGPKKIEQICVYCVAHPRPEQVVALASGPINGAQATERESRSDLAE